jgi:hypothetical protein
MSTFAYSTATTAGVLRDKESGRVLDARWATIIVILYLCLGFAAGYVGRISVPFVARAAARDLSDPRQANEVITTIGMMANLAAASIFAALLLALSKLFFPKSLKDTSPNGAAWVCGSFKKTILGFVLGALLASAYFGLLASLGKKIDIGVDTLMRVARADADHFRLIYQLWLLLLFGPYSTEASSTADIIVRLVRLSRQCSRLRSSSECMCPK